jgi:hypothetical protein
MTTQQIIRLARRKLLETTTDVLPDDVLLTYANESYKDVYKRSFSNSDITSTTLILSGGVATLPANFGTMYGDAQDATGQFYPEQTIEDFGREELQRAVTIEAGQIKARPNTVAQLTVRFWPKPETLTNLVNPTIDDYLHEPIIYGILWRAHEDMQDEELATYYKGRFTQDLKERLSVLSNYQENNQRGGTMFNYQSLV